MHRLIDPFGIGRLVALVGLAFLVSACATELPDFESSPLVDPTPNLVREAPTIRAGDRVEVTFYEISTQSRGPYRIGSGDVLSFNLVGEPDAQASSILVQDDGFASFPLVGPVRVVGKTMTQLDDELKKLFVQRLYSNPLLNLTLVSTHSVAKEELLTLSNTPGSNIFSAIVPEDGRISLPKLGGFNALTAPASLEKSIESRLASRYGQVYGASVNITARAPRAIFVTGAVTQPGQVDVSGPMTPLHAIASAGGFSDTAEPRKVAVIRYDTQGNVQSWIVDLGEVLRSGGKSPTPLILQPRDIVWVPRSNAALTNVRVQQYILNNLPFGIGLGYDLNQ